MINDTKTLSISEFYRIVNKEKNFKVKTATLNLLEKQSVTLKEKAVKETIYGYNTGFGPMAYCSINDDAQNQLQYNLVRSHASGSGDPLCESHVRAIMLARAISLTQGKSAVSKDVVKQLQLFINQGITPLVPQHGSVGASGDLVQLAHIALCLIGEGYCLVNGKKIKTKTALQQESLSPLVLKGRDGLALINGTSAMTGIGSMNLQEMKTLLHNSILLTVLLYEIFEVSPSVINEQISAVRPHRGQKMVSHYMRSLFSKKKVYPPQLENNNLPQEIYSLRCAPQILGPIYDTLLNSIEILETELNSVTDNPIFTDTHILHNGNFHGDYVAHEMDKVRIALSKLSLLQERQFNFLVNPSLNKKFAPYLNKNQIGLNLALQGIQFVATSTTAENQALATPMTIHSIPTNNENQDIVSMGCNSALLTKKVLDNTFEIQAVLAIAILEACDQTQLNIKNVKLKEFIKNLFKNYTPLNKDRSLNQDMDKLTKVLQNYSHTDDSHLFQTNL